MKHLLRYKNILLAAGIIFFFYKINTAAYDYFSAEKEKVIVQIKELDKGEKAIYKWKKFKSEQEELRKVFLSEDALLFKQFVEDTAQAQRVKIMSFRTSRKDQGLYWELLPQLSVQCSYKNLVGFIQTLEEKSIGLEQVEIAQNRDGEGIIVNMNLKGFTLK